MRAGKNRVDGINFALERREQMQFFRDEINGRAAVDEIKPSAGVEPSADDDRGADAHCRNKGVEIAGKTKTAVHEHRRLTVDAENFILDGKKRRPTVEGSEKHFRRTGRAGAHHSDHVVDVGGRNVGRLSADANDDRSEPDGLSGEKFYGLIEERFVVDEKIFVGGRNIPRGVVDCGEKFFVGKRSVVDAEKNFVADGVCLLDEQIIKIHVNHLERNCKTNE